MYRRKSDSWHYGFYIGDNGKCALMEKCFWGLKSNFSLLYSNMGNIGSKAEQGHGLEALGNN